MKPLSLFAFILLAGSALAIAQAQTFTAAKVVFSNPALIPRPIWKLQQGCVAA